MPKLVVDTRTDIKSKPSAALGSCDIKLEDTVKGWKLCAIAQPKIGAVDKSGFGGFKGCNVDITATSNDFTVYLDNVDLMPEGKWAPRVSYKKNVEVQGKKYACDATYAMKGNTSILPNREPLGTDIFKLSVKAPAIGGVTPKVDYGTLTKTATVTLSGKADKADVSLKTDVKLKDSKMAYTANVSYPLPEKMKLAAELKMPSNTGKVSLSKDKYTIELPLKSFDKMPDPMSAVLKIKYCKNFDL